MYGNYQVILAAICHICIIHHYSKKRSDILSVDDLFKEKIKGKLEGAYDEIECNMFYFLLV